MNPGQDLDFHAEKHNYQIYINYMGNLSPNWEWYCVFNPYIVIDDHGYEGNHLKSIIDLTDKGICVRQSFLK